LTKRVKIYIGLSVLLVLALVFAEMAKPKEVNWFPSYTSHHKIPFGTYIFNELAQSKFNSVTQVSQPPFKYLKNRDLKGTYCFINNTVAFGKEELEALLEWTAKGHTLFIASEDFEAPLLDTLGLKTKFTYTAKNLSNVYEVKLTNNQLVDNYFSFSKAESYNYFSQLDSVKTRVVGLLKAKSTKDQDSSSVKPNIIKQSFGKGQIILSTFPQAFTNYFILKDRNVDYTASLMSYLKINNEHLYLDAYYKSGKTVYSSPMYLFLSNRSLKWAYYMVLIAVVCYVIFEGKRKQRAIPIIAPLKNQTLNFTRTISDMYYEKQNHKAIASHKIQYFLDNIRRQYNVSTLDIDDNFIKNLATRSQNTVADTKNLFQLIEQINKAKQINKDELQRLNQLIEQFKTQ